MMVVSNLSIRDMVLDKNPQQQPIDTYMKVSHKKRLLLIGGIIIAIVVIGTLSWWLLQKANTANDKGGSSDKVAVSHVCTSEIIKEASASLAATDQVALSPVVTKISSLKDFDRDPNCLYVVLQYDLVSGNTTASSDVMSKLDRVYDPVVGFSNAFTVTTIPVNDLRKNVAFLVQNAKQDKENAKLGDESTAAGSDAADKFQQEHK
jgi:hypothetical protein